MTVNAPWRHRLTILLSAIFVFALVMGAGPGVYLVNPHPGAPRAAYTLCGMPVIYAWAVFWFAVQAATVVAASVLLWNTDEPQRPQS